MAAVRTAQSKFAVECLHGVGTRDERAASQRRCEKKDHRALKLKLGADPMRCVENGRKQQDGNAEEGDEKH